MPTVFLSYSTSDHYFAELVALRLSAEKIEVWRDRSSLLAGSDWRLGIERGITESIAVLVALSENSAASPYVTYEWAYAMGKGKAIIPLILRPCTIHRKLETIHHLDFSVPGMLQWEQLIQRIREIETEASTETGSSEPDEEKVDPVVEADRAHVRAILDYLNHRGYQMASFERLRSRIDESLTDDKFREIIARNPSIFRRATLRGEKPGIAKVVP